MAYGNGYIPKGKSREFNKQRTTSGGYSAHETRDRDRRGTNEYERGTVASSSRHGGSKKDKTDEEILALGRQLSDFARKQNEHDLRQSGKIKATGLVAAAAAVNEVRKKRRDAKTRGIATSRPHGDYSDSSDGSDWEDASDDEGGFSDAESALAYGSVVSHAIRPTRPSMGPGMTAAAGAAVLGAGAAAMAGRSGTSSRPAESLPAVNVRKSSVVDPRLFGPQNSLRGMINTPCGFGDGQPVADHQQFNKLRRAETEPIFKGPVKDVYPMPTSDAGRFDVDGTRDLPYRSRPAPIPLQQPSPKAPVSAKVYQAEKLEEESHKHSRTRSDETGISAGTKLTGIAAAAAAAVALASERKSKRDSRRDERRKERNGLQDIKEIDRDTERRDRDRDSKRRDKDLESELSRKSKRDSISSKYTDERDHKRHSRQEEDDTPRKRRETKVDHYPEAESSRKSKRSDGDRDRDSKSEVSRSSRRDSRKFDDRDERRKEETTGYDQTVDKYDTTTSHKSTDPFQFQVADGALGSSLVSAATAPARPLTPQVFTVDREPNFDDPPRLAQSDTRLSRKDSFEIERMVEEYKKGSRDYPEGSSSRHHDYEEREHEARNIYEEAKHSTAPVAAAAVASAIAVELARSRDRHRDGYDDDGSRDYSRSSKDPVQEEADRYYREKVTAERIAADEQRSRSASPEKSLINKYDGDDKTPSYNIVTPPDMEDKDPKESRYDGPDADVRIDNKIYPEELRKFRTTDRAINIFTSRDPSCERERPLLNLVYPTPVPSRQPTPSLSRDSSEVSEKTTSTSKDREKDKEKDKDKDKKKKKKKKSMSKDDSTEDYFNGPAPSTVSSTAKSVTWGENSTKSFEIESPGSRSEADATRENPESGDKSRPVLSQTSQWGVIAAAIAGSSSEPANEPEVQDSRAKKKKKKASSDVGVGYRDRSAIERDDLMDDAKSEPPIPGPKPVSPTAEKMPGGFADDIDFAATLAAGLQDTGFDPNIVIDDPSYRRRDSPPRTGDTNGDKWNGSSFADAVTDLTSKQKGVSEPGFFSEPIDMTREDPTGPADEWTEAPKKLSKKEKKKLEKEAKRQSTDAFEPLPAESSETPPFEDVAESQLSKKEKKKLEKAKRQSMEITEPLVTESFDTPTFEDAPESQLTKKEQRKRDKEARVEEKASDRSLDEKDLPREDDYKSREVDDAEWEDSGKKKSKKNRKSRDFEDDTSSKISRTDSFDNKSTIRVVEDDNEWDAPKKSKSKSKRDSVGSEIISRSAPGSEVGEKESSSKRSSRSAPSSEVGERESSSKHSSKSRRRSGTDFDDYGDDPPDQKRDLWDDRDVSSVVSEARGDERRKERRSKRSSLYDDDDAKSVASAPGSSRKSKRSSLYEDEDAARSSVSLSGSPRRSKDKDADKGDKKSSGLFASIFKSGSKDVKDESKKLDKESFLDNAGTLGAGVGLATAAAAIAASTSRSHAAQASFEKDTDSFDNDKSQKLRELEDFDPEIAPRAIKPAIDPLYGDLLPLPPSEPGSPKTPPEDLPSLPDSRPDTPPEERTLRRDFLTHRRRRSTQDTPVKSPSTTAIPISLRLGQRHGGPPSSPGPYRSSPSGSPVTTPESSRRSARISWDSSREIKPLYLLEHSRQGSVENVPQIDLPALPPSEPSEPPSRESPAPGYADLYSADDVAGRGISFDNLADSGLRIDTGLASSIPVDDIAGSQETTPKASTKPEIPFVPVDQHTPEEKTTAEGDPAPVDSMSKNRSSYLLNSTPSSTKSYKSVKSEGSMHSPPESTPTKHLTVDNTLSDIPEDLTSADEHFSDAMEGHSDTFEEARDWFDDVPRFEPVPAEALALEPAPEVMRSAPVEDPEPVPSTPAEDTEPEEWKGMSAKEKKKAKKARKSKELALAGAAVATAATAAVVAPLLTEEPAKIEEAVDSSPPQDEFEQPKKGKKGKKNKKKSLSFEDDLGETPQPQPDSEDATPIAATDAPDTDMAKDLDTVDSETDKVEIPVGVVADDTLIEKSPESVDTAIQEPTKEFVEDVTSEAVPETDTWEAPSKKSKKKKRKSKDASSWDIEPAPEVAPTDELKDLSKDAALELPVEPAVAAEASIEPEAGAGEPLDPNKGSFIESSTEPAASFEADEAKGAPDTAEPSTNAEEMWAAPLSKKDKKKKKKKGLLVDEPSAVERELETSTPPDQEQSEEIKAEPSMDPVAALDADTVTPEDSSMPEQISEPVEPEFAPVSSKGKKKKKKNQQVEDFFPVDKDLGTSTPSEEQPPVETTADQLTTAEASATGESTPASQEPIEPVEAGEAEFAPVSKSKKKKKKGKQLDDFLPVESEPDTPVTVEEQLPVETAYDQLLVEEPSVTEETAAAAQEPMELAEAGEDEFAPVSKGKKKKKKSKNAQFDEPLSVDKELYSALNPENQPTPTEPAFTDEPAIVEQPIVTEEPGTTPQEATVADFEPVSKGKKKKKKSKQLDDFLPMDRELDTSAATEDQPTTILSDQAITAEHFSTEEHASTEQPTSASPESIDAADSEFAPVSSKGKKKKKKSLQLDDPLPIDSSLETPTMPKDLSETTVAEVDAPLHKEPLVVEEDPAPSPALTSEANEDDFAPVTTGKKKKKKDKRKSVQWEDSVPDSTPEIVDAALVSEALGDSNTLEEQTTQKTEDVQPEEQTRSLDTMVSEPLFSQGDAPLEPTQDDVTSFEPTQLEDVALQDAPAEDSWAETSSSKKKGKKNKKKNSQANVWDLLEDKTAEGGSDSVSTFVDNVESDNTQREPVFEAVADTRDILEETPMDTPQDTQAEDEWNTAATGKKSKKKKKGSKSASISELEPAPESPVVTEPIPYTEEPLTEEPEAIQEPEPAVESERAIPTETTIEDEWPQATGKKSKKKKRQSMTVEPTQEEQSSTEPPTEASTPLEIVPDSTASAADPEAEFEVPKKGKKNKKKKNSLSFGLAEADALVESDPWAQDPEPLARDNKDIAVEAPTVEADALAVDNETIDTVKADEQAPADKEVIGFKSLDDQILPAISEDLTVTTADAPEASPSEDIDVFTPVKISKKDKKKKKKQAAWEESVDESVTEPTADLETTETQALTDATPAETSDEQPSATETPVEASTADQNQEPEANPEDTWGGFSLKQSKKDKKKKKAKDKEPEQAYDLEPSPATELTAEQPQETSSIDNAQVPDTFVNDSEAAPAAEPEMSRDFGASNDETLAKEQEETSKVEDDEWAVGLSKKDKKKKKKAKALETEADVSSKATEETPVSEEPETTKVEEAGDDAWTDTMSKKDKKKKNKKAKQGSQYDDVPPETTPIQEADLPYDADARPEAEKVDPLEPATTAQNTGDTEMSDATPRDVIPESHQITADVQEETQEPKDVSMTDEILPPDHPDIAESSAITEEFTTPQDSYAQPSGDPDMLVAQEEPADDEWSMPAAGRKGKKGKKSRRSQVESLSWDESSRDPSEQPTEDKFVHDGEKPSSESAQPITGAMIESSPTDREVELFPGAAGHVESTEPQVRDLEMQDAPAAAPPIADSTIPSTEHVLTEDQQENEAANDAWESTPQRKLSKKDKKKKKQSIIADDPMNESREIFSGDNTPVEPTDQSSETPIIAEDITAEPEEWLPTKKSKKDKKKATKAALGVTALAAALAAGSSDEPIPVSKEEQDQPPTADEPFQLQGSSSWADEMDDFAPVTPAEPKALAAETPQEDDGFGFTVSKKSKKGKKGKSKDLSADNCPTPEPTPASEPFPIETMEETPEPVADEGPIPTETTNAEDEWAMPSKKKGKKGKKSKQNSGTMTPVDPTPASEPIFPEPTFETFESSTEPANAPEVAEGEFTSREIDAPAVDPPAAIDIEDEWAMPSKKKGKKGKKNKLDSGTMTPVDPTPAFEPMLPEPVAETMESSAELTGALEATEGDFTSREIETPAAVDIEDEWAVPSKKKVKKGKKNKMGSGTMTPTEQVPAETIPKSMELVTEPIFTETRQLETEAPEIEPSTTVAVEDEWAIPSKKKSKKGKKDKSGSGISTPANEPGLLADQQHETTPLIMDEEQPRDVVPITDYAPVDVPLEPEEAPRALDLEEPPQPIDNDDAEGWGFEVKKKGKKGKKGKAGSGSMTPIMPLDASAELVKDELWTAEESSGARDEDQPTTTVMHEAPDAPQPTNEEDEWAVPTKKKKGKGKKSKSIPLSVFDEPSTTTSEAEAGPVGGHDSSAMEVDAISAEREDRGFEDIVPKPRGFDNASDTLAANEGAREPTDTDIAPDVVATDVIHESTRVPTEANTDDTWAAPTTKKSKKEKKRKSSQVLVLDSPRDEPFANEEQDPFLAEARSQEAANDEWPDDDFSVPKSKKKKGKKAVESPTESADKEGATTVESNTGFMDDVWGADAGAGDHDRRNEETALSRKLGESVKDDKNNDKSGPSTTETLATASAVAGGVALLAEKFGGGKKKKTKGKQKKILDKRQPQEDDMFDDPALWEGADKKGLDDGKDAELHEDFWGGAAEEEERHEEMEENKGEEELGVTDTREMKDAPIPAGGSFAESSGGWKEPGYHGVPLDDEFEESPILGRGEAGPRMSTEHTGLLRRSTEVGSPVGGLLKERSEPQQILRGMDSESDFRRSPTRGLPAVQEVPEAEAIAAQYNWPTPEMNRDSGFAPESPNPQQRRSLTFQDEAQRDSGVHTDDYRDATVHTPDVSAERRLRRSPFATPVLREPETTIATPEPEKKKSRKATKDYGDVAAMGGAAAAVGLAAKSAATRDKHADKDTPGRRSVSDSPYNYASPAASGPSRPSGSTAAAAVKGLDSSSSPSPRAEPVARRSVSNTSLSRHRTPEPLRLRPESPGIIRSTPTPPLRRIDKRMSGDLRALRQQRSSSSISTPTQTQTPTPSATQDPQVLPPPVANESRVRSKGEEKDMADVYDGYGEGRIGSPRSPTRPHSMRRRQSMQVLELESRVDQLMAENRMLTEARTHAEQNLSSKAASVLTDRDAEIESLKQSLQFLQNEVSRLTEVNEGLTSANAELASKDNGRYTDMTRELDEARGAHTTFTQSLQDKDAEIADLRAQLEEAKEQIRQMQRKILESKAGDSEFLNIKDEDYFDHRCQQLCSHVQQWVLRFSKFSDMRACRLTSEINDEKTIDRLDNSVLDGTDVDAYLRDRVKRRDIFMSMTLNMIWEFVFTRYLFGMDREQRQKLKSLEKLLTDVGPSQAVRQWRAVTLTLLSRRDSFKAQRDLDTEAVVQAVFQTLCKILPPPSNLESQIQSQLRRVMHEAVELSVEMRTQRAEYMMLPPLQPEYDADGELAATVSFDAAMMNERSGHANMTNEELESQGAVVRIVLFPLVVKRGDDDGEGEDKIVVCPAQVLIARDDRGRRQYTPSEAGGASLGAPSRISLVPESMGQPEV